MQSEGDITLCHESLVSGKVPPLVFCHTLSCGIKRTKRRRAPGSCFTAHQRGQNPAEPSTASPYQFFSLGQCFLLCSSGTQLSDVLHIFESSRKESIPVAGALLALPKIRWSHWSSDQHNLVLWLQCAHAARIGFNGSYNRYSISE